MSASRARFATVGLAALLASATAAAQSPAPAAAPAPAASAASAPVPRRLEPVVVTATRTERAAFDVPASIDRIDAEAARDGRLAVNISEALAGVPGLAARDRQNYAQDVQISVRGFGARSTFGIRGVRLYVDGIPATLPDGQGQITNVELGSAERIEVLRGPFSALYGNSSGGVIQVFSEEGAPPPRVWSGIAAGSDNALRLGVKASGATTPGGPADGPLAASRLGYVVGASRFETDGYRDHSAARRTLGNVKLTWEPDGATSLQLVLNRLDLPLAQDPLGLTRAQLEADRRGVDPAALAFDTRKTVEQTQAGVVFERRFEAFGAKQAVRALVYGGSRETEQFQAIPVATQANPLHPGGVISLGRDYAGIDLRWTVEGTLAAQPVSLVAGIAWDELAEHRRGYRNFMGATLGVRGELRRDERNTVRSADPYLQLAWQPDPRWRVEAGVRRSRIRFASDDRFVTAVNPDDSGRVRYAATLPVAALRYAVSSDVGVYLAAGRGFETPTLNELAYRPNGATGLNLELDPATSRSVELGLKARGGSLGEATLAVFETRTEDEIATLTNSGGRATFQNAGRTRRRGVETGWHAAFAGNARADIALARLDARYRDAFATCTAAPCPAPNVTVPGGSRIPGIARRTAWAALAWLPAQGLRGGIEARATSKVPVNDLGSDAAAGYATVGAHLGWLSRVGPWELNGFARVDNALGRRHVGSVIVGEGNGRWFEPAPRRTWTAGIGAALGF